MAHIILPIYAPVHTPVLLFQAAWSYALPWLKSMDGLKPCKRQITRVAALGSNECPVHPDLSSMQSRKRRSSFLEFLSRIAISEPSLRNLRGVQIARYSSRIRFYSADNSVTFLTNMFSSMPLLWWVALIISALGISAICLRVLESDGARAKRAEREKKKELRSLAQRISSYGQSVHQRYPTGDVIVSEGDLAKQLRKRPDAVATALNLLLNEQKVQRATLSGYWKLNV